MISCITNHGRSSEAAAITCEYLVQMEPASGSHLHPRLLLTVLALSKNCVVLDELGSLDGAPHGAGPESGRHHFAHRTPCHLQQRCYAMI
jgi:hypothetical protein